MPSFSNLIKLSNFVNFWITTSFSLPSGNLIILFVPIITMDFDWKFYLLFNPDVVYTFGNSEDVALLHYNTYGKHEKRIIDDNTLYLAYPFTLYFDWIYYRDNNDDLKDINDKYTLISHYLYQGHKENRKINFNSSIYLYLSFIPIISE